MNTPGVTVRPLPEIVDAAHPDLNEVFLSNVVVPATQLVGEMNGGWAMANGSLSHERSMVWLGGVMTLESEAKRLLAEAPKLTSQMGVAERAVFNDQIVQCYTDTVAARCLGYRGLAWLLRGGTAPEQSLMKAFSSESRRRMALLDVELRSASAVNTRPTSRADDTGWIERYYRTFSNTISAGTSEIQRNIIAEQVLGLPRKIASTEFTFRITERATRPFREHCGPACSLRRAGAGFPATSFTELGPPRGQMPMIPGSLRTRNYRPGN